MHPIHPVIRFALVAMIGLAGACDSGGDDGSEATLTVQAEITDPPVTVGQNVVRVTVLDAAGEPVEGATVVVDPQMPSMGHGSTETPVVQDMGDGVYEASPVTFQMPGPWVVYVDAVKGDDAGATEIDVDVQADDG
ncbi:MAG: FixH family protein [Myxococcota bacterium]